MHSISVIIPSLNESQNLSKCLKSIRRQNYQQDLIEIIVSDGGSTDNTAQIIKKNQGKLIIENSGSPESAKATGIKHAKNEIVLMLDCDNILPSKNWLSEMVAVFDNEPDIVGCYTWHYAHNPKDKVLNRYFSLFGANDPVVYFLNKTDRQSYLKSIWDLKGKVENKGSYFVVEFNTDNMPTLGANGFLIKREILLKAKVDENHFFHIDVNYDLVKQDFNKYAVVKNDIFHESGEEFWHFFNKRKKYMQDLFLRDFSKRRYHLYDHKKDKTKIILYSLYSLTIILPLIESIRGYFKKPDVAWFLHPIICFNMFWVYFFAVLKKRINQ